ncbi:glycosyltransferase family 4 protein [Tautonia sociabilis]|uniref:Glycosyltransferase family 1 protein n=1 Tax=Tautonia sociabilis TaxID=2080755 RepID=A0A432ML25_9BACT|nr:glycosyltransferase family 4 protein [Tautonia sociabilis]RUL87836.1 glycosyltransferase family 1 protein [Tautonia sociabilis]
MRILMVTSFPIVGQTDGTAMLAIQVFRALRRRGVEVAHAYLKARRPWDVPFEGEFEGAPSFSLPPSRWIGGMAEIRRRFPFDLVHAEHYGGACRALAACKLNGWPMIYSIHSLLGEEVERDRLGRGLVFRSYRALERQVCRYASGVVVLGRGVKRIVVEEKGVPEERVVVIHPGVNLADYAPGPAAEIEGIDPEHQVIMYVGNIRDPNQGVPILIDALPRVFEARPEARCVLVGGPADEGERYRARLGEWGDRLIVLPGKTPEQITALTRRADVLVHPRLACRENDSVQTKMAVYLASGRPIVATNYGDYQQILGDTGAGLLTPVDAEALADGIAEVLGDPVLSGRLASATRAAAEQYVCMDRNVDRYLGLYETALVLGPRRERRKARASA